MDDTVSGVAGRVRTSLATMSGEVTGLLDTPMTSLDQATLLTTIQCWETLRRQFAAIDHLLVHQLDVRGTATALSHPSTANLLAGLLRLDSADAAGRVRAARELGPRQAMTGEVLEPEFPVLAAAQAAGAVSASHAKVITSLVRTLPADVRARSGATIETVLTGHSHQYNPATVHSLGRRIVDTLDPDGQLTDETDRQRRRQVTLTTRPDGTTRLTGDLTGHCAGVLDAVFDALAQPCPADGLPDQRTAGQRRHDALLDAGTRLLADGGLPDTGGTPTTLLITIGHTDLLTTDGAAPGRTAHGHSIPAADVARLAGDAHHIPVHLTDTGGIRSYGRTRRLASPHQRRALTARDRGCSLPGCTRPAPWTHTHHITDWANGGPTDLENLTLVCPFHHRHALDQGHTAIMINGIPHWTKPPWQDPDQTPRRNYHHHPELLS